MQLDLTRGETRVHSRPDNPPRREAWGYHTARLCLRLQRQAQLLRVSATGRSPGRGDPLERSRRGLTSVSRFSAGWPPLFVLRCPVQPIVQGVYLGSLGIEVSRAFWNQTQPRCSAPRSSCLRRGGNLLAQRLDLTTFEIARRFVFRGGAGVRKHRDSRLARLR